MVTKEKFESKNKILFIYLTIEWNYYVFKMEKMKFWVYIKI